jgi:hypothetical protein
VAQVARTQVHGPAVVIAKVATGDDPEGTDRGQRARLRAAQGVDAIAVTDAFALWTSGQI